METDRRRWAALDKRVVDREGAAGREDDRVGTAIVTVTVGGARGRDGGREGEREGESNDEEESAITAAINDSNLFRASASAVSAEACCCSLC